MFDLKTVIQNTPACLQNRDKLRSVLNDMFPLEKLSVNLVLISYDAGIAERLFNTTDVDDNLMVMLVSRLTDEYGMREENAYRAICLWANATETSISANLQRNRENQDKQKPERIKAQEIEKLKIDEYSFLKTYIDDFAGSKSLKSCCRIIDILFRYAANLEDNYDNKTQEESYSLCLYYLKELKKLAKTADMEKPYDYLALYVEGTLRLLNADFVGAVKAFRGFNDSSEFNNIETKVSWTDTRIDVKTAIYSNLYFLYDLFNLDFGKSVTKSIVDKALEPKTEWYRGLAQEIRERMRSNPECANEPYDPKFKHKLNTDYVPTNAAMLKCYLKDISKRENWINYPRFLLFDLSFKDYGDFVSSDLADAVYEGYDGVNISVCNTEGCLIRQADAIVLEGWWGSKTIVENFSSIKNELATKIRLLYM